MGRLVHNTAGPRQVVWTPDGYKAAVMNGQSLTFALIPLPGGAVANYGPSGVSYYAHPDWEGSWRLASSSSRTATGELAYSPYGAGYAGSGPDAFTGQWVDTPDNLNDFQHRLLAPMMARWLSPDPAGLAAVSPANPQTWNEYAYVGNQPLELTEPLGLDCSGRQNSPDGPTYLNSSASYPTRGGINPTAGFSSTLAAAYDAYASWADAMWLTGGSGVSLVNGLAYGLGWGIQSGAQWEYGPNGEDIGAGASELGLPALPGPGSSGSWSPAQFVSANPWLGGGGGSVAGIGGTSAEDACLAANVAAVNAAGGIGLTPADLQKAFRRNGAWNFDFAVPSSVFLMAAGRYASSPLGAVTGIGYSLHLPAPGGDDPSTYGLGGGLFTFTAHIDSAYATWHTPIGALIHLVVDVSFHGALRSPCP